jgi:hypothetical protein
MKAVQCFNNAGLARESAVEPTLANRVSDTFVEAGLAFVTCATTASTVDQLIYRRTAAECFADARKFKKASELYLSIEEYEHSARQLERGEHYEDLATFLAKYRARLNGLIFFSLQKSAGLHFLKSSDASERAKADPIFETDEEKLSVRYFCLIIIDYILN